jgi:glyoxalase superfamily protein
MREGSMTIAYQITFDCKDPFAVATFWSDALGLRIENNERLIRGLIDAGVATESDTAEHHGRLYWRTAVACHDPTSPVDEATGVGPLGRMLFQQVPEEKSVKNRVHLDLNVGRDRRDEEVRRLEKLGARVLYEIDEPGAQHVTLADVEGNEFCVQ